MNKKKFLEILLVICVGYTLLSLLNAGLALSAGYTSVSASNHFTMLLWTSLGVLIIYSHPLFYKFSPITTILLQYIIAIAMIMSSIYISGFYETLHPYAYRDGFRSFTIPFVIGASIHYLTLYREAKKQNKWLQEIKTSVQSKSDLTL